ncbi:MAG: cupin domain-containing protein [Pseudomonadales bacterium]|nr:cupin domain-containing protein [Pseudomonadales bacterium]
MSDHNTGIVSAMSEKKSMNQKPKSESEYFVEATGLEFWTDERCYITELCNTDKLAESSLAIARVEAGVTTQLHALTGLTETYIVIEGSGQMEVADETFEINPGDQVVIPPGVPQRVTALNDQQLRFYCLCTPRFYPESYVNLEDE